jgi:prophage regulatory protein
MDYLQENSLLRLSQIIGNPKAKPPIPPIIPVKKSCWWAGVKSGRFPKPLKLGPRMTVWRSSDIVALLLRLADREGNASSMASWDPSGREVRR